MMRARSTPPAVRVALCSVLLAVGIASASGARKKVAREAAPAHDSFVGLAVPLNATELYGPESGFRIGGWTSWGGMLKLMELVPDGTEVKEGDLIARFEFHGRDALRHVNERIQKARAEAAQARIATDQSVEGLRVETSERRLQAQLAALDLEKERAISRRQADLYRVAAQIATFEADAAQKRLASAGRAREAELAYHDENVARTAAELARYKFYEQRFQLTAPHAGVVRHGYNARERRKLQKGDAVASGMKLLSVARDQALGVRFFVPEHRLREVTEGARITVVSPASGEELRGKVTRIDFFPQEMGFLMELPTLPNAREKAFEVRAEFEGDVGRLTAGTELRVKMGGR